MTTEPQTLEDYKALFDLLREEAGQRNGGVSTPGNLYPRSDSKSLQNIRKLLHLPRYGFPIQRWETDADGNVYLD